MIAALLAIALLLGPWMIERLRRHEPLSMSGQPLVVWDRAEGIQVFDRWGNMWLDWSSGVLVTNAGHNHPAISQAIADQVAGALVRNVEPRNTPSTVNAVLNRRNFWDSRAEGEFNGVDPIGDLDPTARVVDASGAELPVVRVLSRFQPGTSAVAIPQGVGLLFAAGLGGGADGMTSYLPMELPDAAAEERVLEAWRREAPGVVLVWQQDLRPDFGVEGFGIDYATRLRRWLDERYAVADQPVPGMWILTRRR